MRNKKKLVKAINEAVIIKYKADCLYKEYEHKMLEIHSEFMCEGGILNHDPGLYYKKAKFMSRKVIQKYPSLLDMDKSKFPVIYGLSLLAASYLRAPLDMVCSPVNMIQTTDALLNDKEDYSTYDEEQLKQEYTGWLKMNPDYKEWIKDVEEWYDNNYSIDKHDYSKLNHLVEFNSNSCVLLHHLGENSSVRKDEILKWLSKFDKTLVQYEEITLGKKGFVVLIHGLCFVKGVIKKAQLLELSI